MLKILLPFVLFCINIYALSISSNDDYKVYESKNYNIIYTQDFKNEAKFIKYHLNDFLEKNDKSFGFSFDEPLRLVLISNNIQIPNAFSTQIPFNLEAYYNGGSGMNDYFASKSWLTNLLVHEMVHNYQINAKKSEISKTLHKYLGNNFMPIITPIPLFTLPNLLLPTALLEGNSVLNESIYENGGRLHSGELNALKNVIVFDKSFDTTRFINDHISFPYTTEKYIVGGFYMDYLALNYGFDKVNRFFYENSIHSINPLLLNDTYEKHFGTTFDKSVNGFIEFTKQKYQDFNVADNEVLKTSKDEIYLSKIDNKIYFITTDLTVNKELNSFDLLTNQISSNKTSFKNGKLFKKDEKLYVSSSDFISASLYKHGLFDESNFINKDTTGKDIKAIKDQKTAYIDIKSSSINSKLYINDEFFSNVSSGAIFDEKGNIYYFKQDKDQRILYKNKDAIFKYKGYYGKLVEAFDSSVYFIANTKTGSSLYKVKDKSLFKLSSFDNIVNSKLIDKNTALAVCVTSNGYEVQKIKLKEQSNVDIVTYKVNGKSKDFSFSKNYTNEELNFKPYNELQQMQFSFLYPYFSYDSKEGSTYMLDAIFTDPVMFNMLDVYAYKDMDKKAAGLRYINERYIPFSLNIYDMNRDKDKEYSKERGYGASLEVYGPLYKAGRHSVDLSIKHYLDDKNKRKNPSVISLSHTFKKGFMLEDSPYLSSKIELLGKEDRGDLFYGASLDYDKHIYDEFYINIGGKIVDGDLKTLKDQRGIEVESDLIDTFKDKTTVFMEGSDLDFFVKDISKISAGISKTLYLDKYFYKFPFSLRKESVFYKHNRFDFSSYKDFTVKENIYGIKFDILYFHKLPIPTTIKYISNDLSKDNHKITFTLGMEF